MDVLTDHDCEMSLKAKYPEWDGKHRIKTRPHELTRLIAKIGYVTKTSPKLWANGN